MLLQTVLDLKGELRGIASARHVGMGGVTKVAGHALPAPRSLGVVLGVAPGAGTQDFRIAVRTTRQDASVSSYVNTLGLLTSGEIEVQHVGQIQVVPPGPSSVPWRGRARPLQPGFSVGHFRSTAGTIGAFVERNGVPHILSNNHVLAQSNAASHHDAILQPGPHDGGRNPLDAVSTLADWVPLQAGVNFVDAAIGALDPAAPLDFRYAGQQLGAPGVAQIGLDAWKVGRTTGVTRGVVTAVGLDDVEVRYGGTTYWFDDQIEIQGTDGSFSGGGDSGSLIMDRANNPFGLLFAAATLTGKTFANPLGIVLQRLGATLLS